MSYALHIVECIDSFEPTIYQEAIFYYEAEDWMMTMNEEMKSHQKNQAWDLVELPEGKWVVGCSGSSRRNLDRQLKKSSFIKHVC